MGKDEKTPITVNGQEYILEDFTDRQRALLNHINDLDRKIGNSQFNLEQLSFCRTKFIEDLAQDLESEEQEEEARQAGEEATAVGEDEYGVLDSMEASLQL